jgi:hypothetical protein
MSDVRPPTIDAVTRAPCAPVASSLRTSTCSCSVLLDPSASTRLSGTKCRPLPVCEGTHRRIVMSTDVHAPNVDVGSALRTSERHPAGAVTFSLGCSSMLPSFFTRTIMLFHLPGDATSERDENDSSTRRETGTASSTGTALFTVPTENSTVPPNERPAGAFRDTRRARTSTESRATSMRPLVPPKHLHVATGKHSVLRRSARHECLPADGRR